MLTPPDWAWVDRLVLVRLPLIARDLLVLCLAQLLLADLLLPDVPKLCLWTLSLGQGPCSHHLQGDRAWVDRLVLVRVPLVVRVLLVFCLAQLLLADLLVVRILLVLRLAQLLLA